MLLPFDDSDALVGKLIDNRYELRRKLGEGGMGSVYLAFQTSIERPVCIKFLRRELLSDQTVIKRFLIEAKAASRLTDPHTITIHDFGTTLEGLPFIAMEYLEGVSLRGKLEKTGSLSYEDMARIIDQVAQSLAEAHDAKIIHRDLKPDNVQLTARPEDPEFVKVLDFGIASARTLAHTKVTQTGTIQGTPTYMAPELILGGETDARVDIYALGIMMYEMLAGVVPYSAETPMQVMYQHINEEPQSIRAINPDVEVPRSIHTFIWRCIGKEPGHRPDDARAFRAELAKAVEEAASSGDEPMRPIFTTSDGFRVDAKDMEALATRQAVGPLTGSLLDSQPTVARHMTPSVIVDTRPNMLPWVITLAAAVVAMLGMGFLILRGPSAPVVMGADGQAHASRAAVDAAPGDEQGEPAAEAPAKPEQGSADAEVQGEPPPTAVAAKDTPEPEATPVEPAKPAEVTLSFISDPLGASVRLNGEVIGKTPLFRKIPMSEEPIEVVLTRSGYKERNVKVTPRDDLQIVETLERKARKKTSRPKPRPISTPPTPKPKPRPKPKPKEKGQPGTMKFLP